MVAEACWRERDVRNGARQVMSGSFRTSLPYLWQFVTRPRWVMDFLADGAPRVFPSYVDVPASWHTASGARQP
jgi:hypothetical protein